MEVFKKKNSNACGDDCMLYLYILPQKIVNRIVPYIYLVMNIILGLPTVDDVSFKRETKTVIYIVHRRNTLETKILRNTQDIERLNTTKAKLMAGSGRTKLIGTNSNRRIQLDGE